ncbi:MAG: S-layer homology domain-containing protein [Clostridiales bacterium]|jgi:beta-N-acetylhexosaminidase|nr:S-layer homology domain-containing protein [Clostridiales bacterium]
MHFLKNGLVFIAFLAVFVSSRPAAASVPSSWAAAEIQEAISLNIAPDELRANYQNGITRQEFAKTAVYTAAAIKGVSAGSLLKYTTAHTVFTDTNDPYALCAAAMEIIHGRGGGVFDPKSLITREEAAVMLSQTAKIFGRTLLCRPASYADRKNISDWASNAVSYAASASLMSGVGGGRFDPKGNYTREQAFAVFLRFYKMSDTILEAEVTQTLLSMSLEEKVGQLFICDPGMLSGVWETSNANRTLLNNIAQYHPAGFVFFKPNIKTPEQTKRFIADLQSASKVKLLISVDEEGGLVSRIGANPDMNFKRQPAMSEIGKTGDSENAYRVGAELGEGLRSLGFTMDFAPVADVNTNPDNPVIGTRAFGSDPQTVSSFVVQEVKGLQDKHITAVLKHFPGHGDSSADSHTGAVSLRHNLTRLNAVEFAPFKAGIAAGAGAVMVSHIALPNVTGNSMPASISGGIVTGILRGDLGYNGLVITDSLSMGAVSMYYELPDYCVKAIQAGCDILLMQTDSREGNVIAQFDGAYKAVLNAVKNGKISLERLNRSVERVLRVKF